MKLDDSTVWLSQLQIYPLHDVWPGLFFAILYPFLSAIIGFIFLLLGIQKKAPTS